MKRSILRGTRISASMALRSLLRDERKRDGEAEIGNEWKWMRGIDRQRRQQGKDLAQKMVLQPGLFLFRDIRTVDQHDAMLGKQPAQLAPALLLIARQAPRPLRRCARAARQALVRRGF